MHHSYSKDENDERVHITTRKTQITIIETQEGIIIDVFDLNSNKLNLIHTYCLQNNDLI